MATIGFSQITLNISMVCQYQTERHLTPVPSARATGQAGQANQFLCEEDPYLLELVRYIHLNPIRAVIKDLGGIF